MLEEKLEELHKHCLKNKTELLKSRECGCFYCKRIFNVPEVKDFIEEPNSDEKTAICPYCGIDSVIPSSSERTVTQELLETLNNYWFNT